MAKRLTEKMVEGLRVKSKAYFVWDAAAVGLGLKITPAGRRIWLAQLRYPGHRVQTRRTLGQFPALGLADAREKARQWYALAKSGVDPTEAEEEERRKAEAARRAETLRRRNTFAAVAERYIGERSGNRRAKADAQEIRRTLVKAWGERPIHEIKPRDVRELIDKIKRRAPYDARNAWGHAVQVFKLAVHEELIETSPCASLDKKMLFKNAGIAPRQRTLTDDEVFALWRASGRLGYPAGPLYRLLLLTGCRVSEICHARWSELHAELRRVLREAAQSGDRVDWSAMPAAHKVLNVPRQRFKSDRDHQVQLTDAACALLEGLPRFAGCDFLFSANGETAVWLGTKHKRRLDARMLRTLRALARRRGDDPTQVRLEPWINHDIRRVVRSALPALGVEDHVSELVLGHARKGLAGNYDLFKYAPQIRAALDAWAARLREIITPTPSTPPAKPSNVVRLVAR